MIRIVRKIGLFSLNVIALLTLFGMAALAQSQTLLTRHVRDVVANGEVRMQGSLAAAQELRVDIVLALRNQAELESFLQQVYDPAGLLYRHFVTVPEFTARFGPSQEDYDAAIQFAAAHGLTVVGGTRDAMNVQLKGSVAAMEKAFHVSLGVYQHPTESRTFYAPDREPAVDLPFRLWHISGLDNYSIPHSALVRRKEERRNEKAKSNATTGSCPSASFCGSDMRAAYYGGTSLNGAGQTLGLLEYAGYDIADVNTYYANARQTLNVPIVGISTDGTSVSCVYSSCDDTEQILDITQAAGMAPNLKTLNFYVGSSDTALLGGMSSHSPLDAQLSSSWTWEPSDPSTDDPYFQKMAAQGQSYFQAAGDSGAFNANSSYVFPANDANVISVGGTDLNTAGAGGAWSSESAWVDGGGAYYTPDSIPIPSWQQLAGVITAANQGSTTLRNSPDVSANANFTFYVCADQSGCSANSYGGTSFAAPMWAGYMALVNEQAVSNGNPTVGFINPIIYPMNLGSGYGSAFHDITSGSNGFPAVTGYDLATGWGSPNGAGLIAALSGTSNPGFTLTASPSSLSVIQGNNGTSTITVVPSGGFNGSVSLSANGLPSGVTAGFSTNPTSSTSTLTLTVSTAAATGTSTVTVSGTSGSLTSSATVSLTVASNAGPTVTVSPTALAWGSIVVGESGVSKSTTLTNTGTTTLNISSIGVSGDYALVTSTKPCGSTLAAGKNCIIKVDFTPTQLGTRTGTLTITDNAPSNPQTVALSGTGTAQVKLTPATKTFPSEKVGVSSPAQVFTLTNEQNNASLTGISISTTGDFSESSSTCSSSLAPSTKCTISLVFTPTATGTRTGTLSVSDSGIGSPQTSSLTGTGK